MKELEEGSGSKRGEDVGEVGGIRMRDEGESGSSRGKTVVKGNWGGAYNRSVQRGRSQPSQFVVQGKTNLPRPSIDLTATLFSLS